MKKIVIQNWDFVDSHTEKTTNMDEKNGSTEELSLKCLVSG